jgi:hypothetical protein
MWYISKHQTFIFPITYDIYLLKLYISLIMTISVKNNINPLMQQSVQYVLLSHVSSTQTGWFESTPCIIDRVKNMMCLNLSHRQTSFGLETY